jgi:Protein of unknown function (DUF2905)
MNLGERSACRGAYQGATVYKSPFYFGRRFVKRRSLLSFRMREPGRLLALLGGVITILGLALWGGFGAGWLGRLPGDIRIERGNSAFYFPIVTCLIISVVLSLILSFSRR